MRQRVIDQTVRRAASAAAALLIVAGAAGCGGADDNDGTAVVPDSCPSADLFSGLTGFEVIEDSDPEPVDTATPLLDYLGPPCEYEYRTAGAAEAARLRVQYFTGPDSYDEDVAMSKKFFRSTCESVDVPGTTETCLYWPDDEPPRPGHPVPARLVFATDHSAGSVLVDVLDSGPPTEDVASAVAGAVVKDLRKG